MRMRANLARHARHLVVRHASQASCATYATPTLRRTPGRPSLCAKHFQRTFLGALLQKPPRDVRAPEYEPGWMQIMVWRSRMLDNLRPPTIEEVSTAFKSLMKFKLDNEVPLNTTQALQCRRLLEYLKSQVGVHGMKNLDWHVVRKVLLEVEPMEKSKEHVELARLVYNILSAEKLSGMPRNRTKDWNDLMMQMTRFGGTDEALQELHAKWDDSEFADCIWGAEGSGSVILTAVAQSLALEGREKDLIDLVELSIQKNGEYTTDMHEIMTTFFAQRDCIPETQYWFKKEISKGHARTNAYQSIASFVRRNNLQEWATPIFLDLGESSPRKRYWDSLLRSMLVMGKSIKDVQVMMSHMVDRYTKINPDIETINFLLRAASELEDASLAKDIIAIAEDMDLRPNEQTYMILLDLHVSTGSIPNAQAAYQGLQDAGSIGTSAHVKVWLEYRSLINRYLLMLNNVQPPDFDGIMKVLDTVEEERIHLDPKTVGALCLRFLDNEQHFDVMDILSIHAFKYSEAQRQVVQGVFVTFCLDPSTSTSRAWAAYQLLQQYFQDLNVDNRTKLMQSFFDRRRPDMATYVFGHMRQHNNKSFQPTLDIYVQCLEGFSQNPDEEGTEMIHNMLKMDTRIQPNTRLYTALMLAYTGCKRPYKAMEFWNDIGASVEGPSYSTLEAVFWALEKLQGGDKKAREIWQKIERMDLEVPSAVYNAYVGAVAASGKVAEVKELIMKMGSNVGHTPEAITLGIAYNASPGQNLQSEFQEWAQKHYSTQWAELKRLGRRVNEDGLCQFKLDRKIKA